MTDNQLEIVSHSFAVELQPFDPTLNSATFSYIFPPREYRSEIQK